MQDGGWAVELDHAGAVALGVGSVDFLDGPEHATVEDLMQPLQGLSLDLIAGNRCVCLIFGGSWPRSRRFSPISMPFSPLSNRAFGGIMGERVRVEAQLLDDGHIICHHPFAVDAVPVHHAVGDGSRDKRPASRGAKMTILRVSTTAGHEVRKCRSPAYHRPSTAPGSPCRDARAAIRAAGLYPAPPIRGRTKCPSCHTEHSYECSVCRSDRYPAHPR